MQQAISTLMQAQATQALKNEQFTDKLNTLECTLFGNGSEGLKTTVISGFKVQAEVNKKLERLMYGIIVMLTGNISLALTHIYVS